MAIDSVDRYPLVYAAYMQGRRTRKSGEGNDRICDL
jgi:hypothetical protein